MAEDPKLPMFYRRVVPLSTETHADWYVDVEQGFSFAENANSVYVAASEFQRVSREYPIVFARDANNELVPAALLGLQKDSNLFIDGEGRWSGEYIPAYVRRYPFILATEDNDQFTVCIDEAYSGFNTAKEGHRLIEENGEHGELLENSVKFLREFHQHTLLTAQFCKILDDNDLLEPVQANISLASGQKFSLSGLVCVAKTKLKALSAEKVHELLSNEALDLIYLHMYSLANFDRLIARTSEQAVEEAAEVKADD